MATDTQRLAAFEVELTRLSAEVSRLAGIREVLARHAHNLAVADLLVEHGRMLERDAQATRRAKPGPRRRRSRVLAAGRRQRLMNAPGGDAMTVRYDRGDEAAFLKCQGVRRPRAWWIRPAEVARLSAEESHCETRKCRQAAVIVTWRWWRSTAARRVLVAEHVVCEAHGTGFVGRHRFEVDPAGEVEARLLGEAEMASFAAAGRHCDGPGCENPATCIFAERYTACGEPRADEDLSCDDHAGMFAARLHVAVAPEPDAGGSR